MCLKIVSIVGARPQFIKAAALSRELRKHYDEILVHTGQHYDENMSALFFEELDIPLPDCSLQVGSGSHAKQTGDMLVGIEQILIEHKPDRVLIYGDTNSTLAGTLAAAKLHIPIVHVEAGLRSFNRKMPEEINRIVADQLSALLLCPSDVAVENLAREGITEGVFNVGDVMADALYFAVNKADETSDILQRLELDAKPYYLATVHRAENTDAPHRMKAILDAFNEADETIIFPVHPRTRQVLKAMEYIPASHVRLIDPVGYIDMVQLERFAKAILTDSGGIQKEAYWLHVPCITLRDETEWVETVEAGWNTIVGADKIKLLATLKQTGRPPAHPVLYGDGHAVNACIQALLNK